MPSEFLSLAKMRWTVLPWTGTVDAQVRTVWDSLLAEVSDVPLTNYPEWLLAAVQARVSTPAILLVVYVDEHPVALFPLQRQRGWHWSIATPLMGIHRELLVHPQWEAEAMQGLAEWLRAQSSLAVLTVNDWASERQVQLFAEACRRSGMSMQTRPGRLPWVVSHLAESWEDFLAALKRPTRRDIVYAENHLRRAYPDAEIEVLSDPSSCLEASEALIAFYRRRWCDQAGGSFFDDRRNRAMYRQVIDWAAQRGYAHLSILRVQGHPIVVKVIFHIPGQTAATAVLVGRDTETLPSQFSPGLVEFNASARWAIARGCATMNLGLGATPYKMKYAATQHTVWDFTAARSALGLRLLPILHTLDKLIHRGPVHLVYRARKVLPFGRHPKRMYFL